MQFFNVLLTQFLLLRVFGLGIMRIRVIVSLPFHSPLLLYMDYSREYLVFAGKFSGATDGFCMLCVLLEHIECSLSHSGWTISPRRFVDNLNSILSSSFIAAVLLLTCCIAYTCFIIDCYK